MNKKILVLGDIAIVKCKFHYPKSSIWIDNLDIDKILLSTNCLLVKTVIHTLFVKKEKKKLNYCLWC